GYDVNDGSHEDDMYGGVSKNLKDVEGESDRQTDIHSEDPFGIYEVLNKKRDGKNIDDKHEDSLKYPPGFTPNEEGDVLVEKVDNWSDENIVNDGQEYGVCVGQHVHERVEVSNDTHESTCSGHFKKSEVHRKGLAQKAKKDWVKELCVSYKVNFLSLKETKMEKIDLWCIKRCWGNFTFDYVYSESVGKSRGILCVWDPNMFQKINDTVSDYFIMIRGVWVSSGKRLLILSVYAPPDLSEKKILWDYLSFVIRNWDGEVVIMGDVNEVRDISGSIFNKHGAEAFNSFIVNAGLVEVLLGGCSSAKKMSKLDRFLISDNLMFSCPSISSTSLDIFLSDHRPVIMREAHYDFWPITFKRGSDADGHRRREVVRLIQEVEKVDAMEVAQKLKLNGPSRMTRTRSIIMNDELEREVSNEEIKRAVWDCGIDKAPGPDSFTFGFYRRYWDIIGNDVVDAVKWFFCMERSRKEVLANRLVTVLDDIVDEIQSAFVTDRQILDSPFILNEIVHWYRIKKKQSMIFKVDFEKAYDSVRWDFIDDILRRFGFGEKWCLFNWIKLDSSLQIPHLFYADDAIFMGQWSQCNIDTIIRVLDVFYRASGLRINMNKSNLMGIFVDSNKLGNGVNTSFWDVAWCGDIAFKKLVPRLYALESMKNIEVALKLSHG
nr:RNA-directed DNA polymerase, eukaryota [Tanacetum cinerariifolium]